MANYNKILLIGNLTRDPQLSYLPSQTAVVDFGLAVNRNWTGKDGTKREETCFVDCRAFARTAENINKYLSKGRPLFVEGRLTYNTWTSQDGTRHSKHRVTVENFQFLGGAPGSGKPSVSGIDQAEPGYPEGSGPQTQQDASGSPSDFAQNRETGPDSMDDIPF